MSTQIPVLPRLQFFDSNGDPLAGGKLYTYESGTVVPKATYTDEAGISPNTNPVILDANGFATVRVESGSYTWRLDDANDVLQWSADDITSVGGVVSTTTGVLLAANNLADVDDAAAARTNLGIVAGTESSHAVSDGQAAADLTGVAFDGATYTSVKIEAEIRRGTTVMASVPLAMQYLNSTWRVVVGGSISNELHGVTFSVSQTSTVGQLRAALDSGAGGGTIKIKSDPFSV